MTWTTLLACALPPVAALLFLWLGGRSIGRSAERVDRMRAENARIRAEHERRPAAFAGSDWQSKSGTATGRFDTARQA